MQVIYLFVKSQRRIVEVKSFEVSLSEGVSFRAKACMTVAACSQNIDCYLYQSDLVLLRHVR